MNGTLSGFLMSGLFSFKGQCHEDFAVLDQFWA